MTAPSPEELAKAQSLLTQGHTAARLGPLNFTEYQIRFIAAALAKARREGAAAEREIWEEWLKNQRARGDAK